MHKKATAHGESVRQVRSHKAPATGPNGFDLRLIRLLEADPRASYTQLASHLGVSRTTAKAALDRLRASGMNPVCFVDSRRLGYAFSMLLYVQTVPGAVLDVAARLASLAETRTVFVCSGPFDIVCLGVFKDPGAVPDFLQGLGRIVGISRCETVPCEEIKPNPPASASGQGTSPAAGGPPLDQLDLALIEELRHNTRITVTELSARLGSSRSTVLRKMNRLVDGGVMRMATVWGPNPAGSRGIACVGLRVSPARIKDAAAALASLPRIPGVQLCSGRYDVVAWVAFRDHRELIDFLVAEVGRVPGIASMETAVGLKLVKA